MDSLHLLFRLPSHPRFAALQCNAGVIHILIGVLIRTSFHNKGILLCKQTKEIKATSREQCLSEGK